MRRDANDCHLALQQDADAKRMAKLVIKLDAAERGNQPVQANVEVPVEKPSPEVLSRVYQLYQPDSF